MNQFFSSAAVAQKILINKLAIDSLVAAALFRNRKSPSVNMLIIERSFSRCPPLRRQERLSLANIFQLKILESDYVARSNKYQLDA